MKTLSHIYDALHRLISDTSFCASDDTWVLNFLKEAIGPSTSATDDYLNSVQILSTVDDIALIDDRQKHEKYARLAHGDPYAGCLIASENLSIVDLCSRLGEDVLPPSISYIWKCY